MPASSPWSLQGLLDVIAHHWGFSSLRPLQEQAMRAVLERKDSLVVLPTGGGKSLCYQAPAVSFHAILLPRDLLGKERPCNGPPSTPTTSPS